MYNRAILFSALLLLLVGCISDMENSVTSGTGEDHTDDQYQYFVSNKADSMVFFAFNSSGIGNSAYRVLGDIAEQLRADGSAHLRVVGHCDQRGTREYNIALGERRAAAAKAVLVGEYGIDPMRVVVDSKGKDDLLVNEETETAYSKNRRGEFFIMKKTSFNYDGRQHVSDNPNSGETDFHVDGINPFDDQ